VREGDTIVFDIEARELRLEVPADEIARRLADWKPPAPRYATGVFAKYALLVSSASEGATTGVASASPDPVAGAPDPTAARPVPPAGARRARPASKA
jgi:dihydroxy-acid dehydratase